MLTIFSMTVRSADQSSTRSSIIQFENFSVANGLAYNSVRDMVQDQRGFLWIATWGGGLSRFDGYEFRNYYAQGHPHGIPSFFINDLMVDANQLLWVATRQGLFQYDPQENIFLRYSEESVFSSIQLPNGEIVVATTSGLYNVDLANQTLKQKTLPNQRIPNKIENLVLADDKLWLSGPESGLYIYDTKLQKIYSLADLSNPWKLTLAANSIFEAKKVHQEYWLGTDSGLFILDSKLQVIRHLTTESTFPLIGNNIKSILPISAEEIWIGTDQGLSIVNRNFSEHFSIDTTTSQLHYLKDTFIHKLMFDQSNSVWVGTHAGGLHKYNASNDALTQFKHIQDTPLSISPTPIWAVEEDVNSDIWLATQNGGINKFNPDTGIASRYLTDLDVNVWDLALDAKSQIWLATDNGVYAYRLAGAKLEQIAHFFKGVAQYYVRQFDGKIWFSFNNNQLATIDVATLEQSQVNIDGNPLSNIHPLHLDSLGRLWLHSNEGLFTYSLKHQQLSKVDFSGRQLVPTAITETVDNIWLATLQSGMFKVNKRSLASSSSPELNTILDGAVVINLGAQNTNLWVSTNKRELFEYDLVKDSLRRFISKKEINDDINEGAMLISSNGSVMLGGTNALTLITPAPKTSGPTATPVFTELLIYNKPLDAKQLTSRVDRPLENSSFIHLQNQDSPFSLKFAVLNPTDVNSVSYRYQMIGLSDKWIDTGDDKRQVTFTNLGFGSYKLRIQAKEKNGEWSEPSLINIEIDAPLWLHPYALLAYGLITLFSAAYWFRQFRLKRLSQRKLKESEERLKLSLWSSGDEIWDWNIGKNEVIRSNTWGTIDFPMDNQRCMITGNTSNIHPNDLTRVQRALKAHLKKSSEYYEVSYRVLSRQGAYIWVLDRGRVTHWNDMQPLRMAGTLKDVTHLKQSEEQLRLFKRSIETISDGVFITDKKFQYISVNQAYCKITGETRARALATRLAFNQYPEAFTTQIKKVLRQKGNWLGEIESIRASGEKYEIELNIDAIYGEDNQITHYVGVFSDISGRKRAEKELLKLANTDTLTNLPNRSFFLASLQNLVRRNKKHVLICLDMDNFKKINDSMGHQTGDKLIGQIAQRLQRLVGDNETVYRLGGDEFSLLVERDTDMHKITNLAQRVLSEMARPFTINRQEFVLGCSVGIAFFPNDGKTPQELLKNADTAMYFAKNAGGNKYQFFSGEMNQNAVRQLQLETLIRHGLKEDLFTVFYQPKVDVASGDLVSMEALVRFEHPEKGIISPGLFIPLSEETGQIIDIGERVMLKACADTQKWVSEGLFKGRVAINLSARQFELPDLDERIAEILRKTGLSPRYLELEITEGTLMQNPAAALETMQRLRDMGIHLALDDFGTGYSSLAYLKKFPLNTLKIDKAFIDDIVTSEVDRHMTSAIITIAHNLGLKVVAEGVEDEKQLAILRRYQCEMIQGFLYSKPLNRDRFARLLTESDTMRRIISHQL